MDAILSREFYKSKTIWLAAGLIGIVYLYLKFIVFRYWIRRGIPHDPPKLLVGNLWPVIKRTVPIGQVFQRSYTENKMHPYHGIYTFHIPQLMINDPELIRLVLSKQFAHFPDRGLYFNEKADPLAAHLFFLSGERWVKLRRKLTPSYTAGRIKQMFILMKECGQSLTRCLEDSAAKGEIVEMKDIIARYTTDVISSTAFGWNCNSIEDPNNEFRSNGRKFFAPRPITNAVVLFAPAIADLFGITLTVKDVSNFFYGVFRNNVEYRWKNNIERQDFLNMLMQFMTKGYLDKEVGEAIENEMEEEKSKGDADRDMRKLTMLEGAAQAMLVFLAGSETSSSTVSFALWELSANPDIQQRVREDIREALKKHGDLTYECLAEMTYLEKVISETLRKHPPLPMLNRICVDDLNLPDYNLHIQKGMRLLIPVLGLHRDPEIFPNPDVFDPERFDKENVAKRHPFTYLPFGEGPRYCIGKRFGMIQTKVALVALLSNYTFSLCSKTDAPMKWCPGNVILTPKDALYLRIGKVDEHQ